MSDNWIFTGNIELRLREVVQERNALRQRCEKLETAGCEMTDEEIRNMPAGREMDALIDEWMDERLLGVHDPKPYSTDIAAAWEVVKKLQEKYALLSLELRDWDEPEDGWYFRIGQKSIVGYADTAPLAICRAALLAALALPKPPAGKGEE